MGEMTAEGGASVLRVRTPARRGAHAKGRTDWVRRLTRAAGGAASPCSWMVRSVRMARRPAGSRLRSASASSAKAS